MTARVRYTRAAREDLKRLHGVMLERDHASAEQALAAIGKALALIAQFPFSCRKAVADTPLLRELLVSFGSGGDVLLYEIENADAVTILAVRDQREDDYH